MAITPYRAWLEREKANFRAQKQSSGSGSPEARALRHAASIASRADKENR